MGRILAPVMLFVAVGLAPANSRAQAIIAPGGRTLFHRASLVRSFVDIQSLSVSTPDGKRLEVTQYVTPLAFVYGFHPNWSAIAVLPYVTADVTTRGPGGSARRNLNGLTDAQFFVQYDGLYNHNTPGAFTRLSGVFGLRAPTGADRFSTHAFAYTGGLILEKASLKYVITADFQYTFATKNDQGLSVGDSARFDLVPAYFIFPKQAPATGADWFHKLYYLVFRNGAYALLEFNGNWQGRAQQSGADLGNTGGTTLAISPGIQYFVNRRFLIEFSAPIPVLNDLNGVQPELDSRFLVGFRWLF